MNERDVIMIAPSRKKQSLRKRSPGIENSCTTISVHPMYTNVPAANEENITSTITPALEARIPITIPSGVAIEKTKSNLRTKPKSFGKFLTRLMPRAPAAAPL